MSWEALLLFLLLFMLHNINMLNVTGNPRSSVLLHLHKAHAPYLRAMHVTADDLETIHHGACNKSTSIGCTGDVLRIGWVRQQCAGTLMAAQASCKLSLG